MSKLSPKPWSVHPHTHVNGERSWEIQHGKDGEVVCNLDAIEQIEDARLIAAAPDLLEALVELEDLANSLGIPTEGARAAIAKAKGGKA
jgi:hypothetical protein